MATVQTESVVLEFERAGVGLSVEEMTGSEKKQLVHILQQHLVKTGIYSSLVLTLESGGQTSYDYAHAEAAEFARKMGCWLQVGRYVGWTSIRRRVSPLDLSVLDKIIAEMKEVREKLN